MNVVSDSLGTDVLVVAELPLFYDSQFASTDTIQLTRYYTQRFLASGQEGLPLSYSPRADDGLAILLLICFLLTSIAVLRNKRFLGQLGKNFLLKRERASIFSSSTSGDSRTLLFLGVQTSILSGICFFNFFNDLTPSLLVGVKPWILLTSYILICLAYFSLKRITYGILGWMFFYKISSSAWLESYSTLIYYVGFLLFPFVLFVVYFNPSFGLWVGMGACLFLFTKILMFYKWIKLFSVNFNELLLLILYFCALEIIPCLMLYKGVMELNNYLVTKF